MIQGDQGGLFSTMREGWVTGGRVVPANVTRSQHQRLSFYFRNMALYWNSHITAFQLNSVHFATLSGFTAAYIRYQNNSNASYICW